MGPATWSRGQRVGDIVIRPRCYTGSEYCHENVCINSLEIHHWINFDVYLKKCKRSHEFVGKNQEVL